MPTKLFTLGVVWKILRLDLNMQIGKTHKRNTQHNTTQNQKDKNKYIIVLSYKYTHTHTNKITEIILGKDIYQSNVDLLYSLLLFYGAKFQLKITKTCRWNLIICEKIYRSRRFTAMADLAQHIFRSQKVCPDWLC